MIHSLDLWPLENFDSCPFIKKFYSGNFEIKYPWEWLKIIDKIISASVTTTSISPKAHIAKTAIIVDPVIIESEAVISDYAKIVGPSYIGKKVTVGNFSLIRNSVVEKNSVIGYSVDVARSYIGQSCWLSRSHVADSILHDHVNIGGVAC